MHKQNVLHEWVWRSRQQVTKNFMAAPQTQLKLTGLKTAKINISIGKKHAAINFKTWQEKIHQYNLTYTLTTAWSIKSILFWTNTIGIPPHSSSTCKGMMQNNYVWSPKSFTCTCMQYMYSCPFDGQILVPSKLYPTILACYRSKLLVTIYVK